MKNLCGFLLVEGILAISILGIGLMGLLYMYQDSVAGSLKTDQTVIAINLARATMETIAARKDCTQTGCGYASTIAAIASNAYNANPVSGFPGFVLTTTVTEVDPDDDNSSDDFLDASSGSGYARVTVQVAYNNNTNIAKLEALFTSF